MSRSLTVIRDIGVDHKYGSATVMSLINKIMKEGKKSIAEKIVYNALDIVSNLRKGSNDSEDKGANAVCVDVLEKAVENLAPEAEVRYKKVGGATCTVPREPSARRKRFLAMMWLIKAAKARSERTMSERLAHEMLAASNNEGNAYQEKIQLQKLAESNRAYAVFNW